MGISYSDLSGNLKKKVDQSLGNTQGTQKAITFDQTIFIDELPPMLNGENGLQRMHWTQYRKVKETWVALVAAENPDRHEGQVNVRFTRKSVQTPDPDNVSAGFKVVGDALVANDVIEDDSFNVIKNFDVRWEKSDTYRAQGVRIEIESVE
jgi:hypothetical protein